ncbi:hypothetical protein [Paratissierella segnis]|jgi:hypothetical protein|uniref:Uncharacterized protein n=1 Tax=Paratissierella segnis TaxID=2763679 RepID=A0A926ILC8_9FIRM|nr:hypothetical protein [Paratissierella segnis]MBC8589426.1 hypothetical protein [Paratissierella segnis]
MIVDFNDRYLKRNLRLAMDKLGIDNEEGLAKYDTKNINDDMIKILEKIISRKQYLEDEFYKFTRATVSEEDCIIFFAFLLEYFQGLIAAFEGANACSKDNEDFNIIMRYLYDNKMKVLNSYISRELLENIGWE